MRGTNGRADGVAKRVPVDEPDGVTEHGTKRGANCGALPLADGRALAPPNAVPVLATDSVAKRPADSAPDDGAINIAKLPTERQAVRTSQRRAVVLTNRHANDFAVHCALVRAVAPPHRGTEPLADRRGRHGR